MPKDEFTPPKFVEMRHYIFDKKTGDILATETKWSLRKGKRTAAAGPSRELLASIASQSGKREAELDVLVLNKPRPGTIAVRVDVRRRKLVTQKVEKVIGGPGSPQRLPGP